MKILIADDIKTNRDLLETVIEYQYPDTFEFIHAIDGRDTLEKVSAEYFHIILLDITMPYIDGIEVCTAIKKLIPETRIIIITAHALERKNALNAGADYFMTKPIDIDELLILVSEIMYDQP